MKRTCAECEAELGQLPQRAPHKRFCSASCRLSWHSRRRKAAKRLLEECEAQAGAEEKQWQGKTAIK